MSGLLVLEILIYYVYSLLHLMGTLMSKGYTHNLANCKYLFAMASLKPA